MGYARAAATLLVSGSVTIAPVLAEDASDRNPATAEVSTIAVIPPAPPESVAPPDAEVSSDGDVQQAQRVQEIRPGDQPAPMPRRNEETRAMSASLSGITTVDLSALSRERREQAGRPATSIVSGAESKVRPSTDIGSLLGNSPSGLGIEVQRRNPITTDTRSRGERAFQLVGVGSYWVPARQDLDTLLSKIDSGLIADVIAIKGPYSAIYGPGLSFVDTELLPSPRFADGLEWHGSTSMQYRTNGEQLSGRQAFEVGSTDWGFRGSYGLRTANDYDSGDGTAMPASFISGTANAAIGFDLSEDSHIEFQYLRLDQSDVEYPGQIFDMNFLVTDAFEARYTLDNQCYFDRLNFESWYNRTRFEGNAQRAGKRRQIPELNPPPQGVLDFFGVTDVDSMSTGYTLSLSWGESGCAQCTLGADLRYIEQELNEFDSFGVPGGVGTIANFPIPRAHSSNPGLFAEQVVPIGEKLTVKGGARVDWVSTNTEGDTPGRSESELHAILGTNNFDREWNLWAAYITGEYRATDCITAVAGFGHAERPPTLTELYAVDPFLAILQQGFTQVRGDPGLHAEKAWQMDLGMEGKFDHWRAGISGFYAWINDYITYEARDDSLLAAGVSGGLGVNFVNTDLATLSGGEMHAEYDWTDRVTPFGQLSYVEGRDHSRGDRGIIPGSDEEPLPGIAPLESRVGIRLHDCGAAPRWGIELAARIVDPQDRVATSLLEQPTAGFTTYDLRGYWHARDSLLLVAGVENFTDKNYHEHLDLRTGTGVLQPGISFYFGAEWTY